MLSVLSMTFEERKLMLSVLSMTVEGRMLMLTFVSMTFGSQHDVREAVLSMTFG